MADTQLNVTTSVQIVMPQHCNGYSKPRLFGGQIMAWIDIIGAVAARQYTHCNVTTVCVDNLSFMEAAHLNDVIVQEAVVTWTGTTSLEVRVDSFVERLDGSRYQVNRAYLVFVALGEDERPTCVPKFTPRTPEAQAEWQAAERRREIRLGRSKD